MARQLSHAAQHSFLDDIMSREGFVERDRLSSVLRVIKRGLAVASGLSRDAVSKSRRVQASAAQARLLEAAAIINRILPWCGSVAQAFAWYRLEPIAAFGDQTTKELVRAGRSEHPKSYLAGIAFGGYA